MFTPLAGKVVAATINPEPQDYGGLILLKHEPEPDLRFWTPLGASRLISANESTILSTISLMSSADSAFSALRHFLTKRMRMSHVNQPLMLKSLMENDGRASIPDIALVAPLGCS
jgi:hypothetical protein